MSDLMISVLSYLPRKVRIEHVHVTDSVWNSLLRHGPSHREVGLCLSLCPVLELLATRPIIRLIYQKSVVGQMSYARKSSQQS